MKHAVAIFMQLLLFIKYPFPAHALKPNVCDQNAKTIQSLCHETPIISISQIIYRYDIRT